MEAIRTWCLAAVLALGGVSAPAALAQEDLAIVNARVLPAPDAEPIDGATVLVRDGRIAAVGDAGEVALPNGVEVIDGAGLTLAAGYWNSHVHLETVPLRQAATQPAAALTDALRRDYARWGFTTIFDIGSLPGASMALRGRIERGEVAGPRVLTVDAPFFPAGGLPFYVPEEIDGQPTSLAEVATAGEAAARAREQLSRGADGLKIFTGALVGGEVGVLAMDPDIAAAVVGEAHAAGKRVFAHPSNLEGIRVALDAGADVLAHTTPMAGPWPEGLAERLVADGVAMVPSLKLFEIELAKDDAPPHVVEPFMAAARQQLAAFSEAGGTVLFGTDSGYIDWYDPGDELQLMHSAGLGWRQLLASLTTGPAAFFGEGGRRGRVAEGMVADLVLLGGDPAVDVGAFADVRYTVRGGRVIHRAGD